MILALLLLVVAGGVVFLAERGPAPAGSPGPTAPAAAATSAPTTSAAAAAIPASAAEVITNNVLVDNVGTPCSEATTLHMKWVLHGVAPGTTIVVDMSGPGLPAQKSFVVAGDDSVVMDYTVPAGAAVWMTDLVEIGNEPAPSANATNKSTVTCSGP